MLKDIIASGLNAVLKIQVQPEDGCYQFVRNRAAQLAERLIIWWNEKIQVLVYPPQENPLNFTIQTARWTFVTKLLRSILRS